MTALVAVTQRVDTVPAYGERRDCLDQRWHELLAACGFLALPVPNRVDSAIALVTAARPSGVLLTGGNDLVAYGGDAPERDETEAAVIAWARRHRLPVLGVCRGMQVLLWLADARLEAVDGHVARRHEVTLRQGSRRVVNSFHRWAARRLPADWTAEAVCGDGVVEAARHVEEPLLGIMWHPEREADPVPDDLALLRNHFKASP